MNDIGSNIKRLRTSRRMTQQKLADIVGAKNYTTITKWESGSNSPQGKDLIVLSKLFNVSIDSILGINDDIKKLENNSSYNYYPLSISAGTPFNVEATSAEQITIPDAVMGKWAGHEGLNVMRINGQSMNKVIPDQSLIAVKTIDVHNLKDNDIVVFSDDNDYSIKRFYNDKENERFVFSPESNEKSFIDYTVPYSQSDNLKIHGKVVIYIVELD